MAYIYASWKFFDDRIHDEEMTLIYFFGDDYLDYQKKVPATGVPYVKGYEFEDHPKTDSAKLWWLISDGLFQIVWTGHREVSRKNNLKQNSWKI